MQVTCSESLSVSLTATSQTHDLWIVSSLFKDMQTHTTTMHAVNTVITERGKIQAAIAEIFQDAHDAFFRKIKHTFSTRIYQRTHK